MKIAVCDDVSADRLVLIRFLREFIGENFIGGAELREYSCAEELLADSVPPDLIFLDIYMRKISGLEAARQLLARGFSGGIVFTTSSLEFGAESYDVNALDYLVKPFSYERFLRAVRKNSESLQEILASITVPSGRQSEKVFLRELCYVETGSHCVLFHTRRDTLQSPMTMAEAESVLLKYPAFIRCHRSYIVNLNAVDDVTDTHVILTNGDRVLLNVKNAASLRRRIADYLWNSMEARHG